MQFGLSAITLPGIRPALMGILNVTPDSFSDGGVHFGSDSGGRTEFSSLDDPVRDGIDRSRSGPQHGLEILMGLDVRLPKRRTRLRRHHRMGYLDARNE